MLSYKFRMIEIKCTLTLPRENSKSYWSNLVKLELKIMKEALEDIENSPQIKPISTFFAKCSHQAKITRSRVL